MNNSNTYITFALLLAGAALIYKRFFTMNTTTKISAGDKQTLPRGYRNNNPLNIRYYAANNWLGHIPPANEGEFERFISLEYGYRAALVILRNYIQQGTYTISDIISRWAPETENDVKAYINDVVNILKRLTGREISPFDAIGRNDRDMLTKLAYAMSIHENGYTDKKGNNILSTYGLPSMEIINKAYDMI